MGRQGVVGHAEDGMHARQARVAEQGQCGERKHSVERVGHVARAVGKAPVGVLRRVNDDRRGVDCTWQARMKRASAALSTRRGWRRTCRDDSTHHE